VLPSRHEQSGSLALIEALQAGLPVVSSGCDGIPEDVTDGEDALLVEPGDARALAAALLRVLTDAELRKTLGRRARQTFERRFSADRVVAALRELSAELGLPGPASPPRLRPAASPDPAG
jgi:glycosyltransferase involved in cell wall biosynthesis